MGSGEEKRAKPRSGSEELTKLAYQHLQRGDAKKATEHFESAAGAAKEEGDDSTAISCYLNAGACLVSKGQLKQGNKLLLVALKLAKGKPDDEQNSKAVDSTDSPTPMIEIKADIYYNLAVAAQKIDDTKKAVSYFKMSAECYLESNCAMQAAESLVSLAGCYKLTKELEKEVESLQSAQLLYHKLEDHYQEAHTCLELAKTHLRDAKVEQTKEMLSTAKLLCMRVDNRSLLGKLYSQFGLIYTSMGFFDLGIENFERALPLVRDGTSSQELEAALLQNIGAAYNEKAMFLDAMVYHKEAAAIHGKIKNYNSESKSLCNLAYAQTQLQQFREAAHTFSQALGKAHRAGNSYLQFQSCEGLGSISQQLGRYEDAITCFQRALVILDQIREDTGIARERVMEKLSEAMGSLEKVKQVELDKQASTSGEPESEVQGSQDYDRQQRATIIKKDSELSDDDVLGRNDSLTLSGYTDSVFTSEPATSPWLLGPLPPLTPTPHRDSPVAPRPSITERRGIKALPPILAKEPSKPPTHKHAVTVPRKGKTKASLKGSGNGSDFSADLKAYMDSYRDSSNESSHSSWSQDLQAIRNESKQLSAPGPSSSSRGQEVGEEAEGQKVGGEEEPSPQLVKEGSLAIGLDARENFTVETVEEWNEGKGGKKRRQVRKEIVQTGTSATAGPSSSQHHHGNNGQPSNTSQPTNQSRLCTIL